MVRETRSIVVTPSFCIVDTNSTTVSPNTIVMKEVDVNTDPRFEHNKPKLDKTLPLHNLPNYKSTIVGDERLGQVNSYIYGLDYPVTGGPEGEGGTNA